MTVNEKLCKNIALKFQATYDLDIWGDSNKYPKHMSMSNFLHIILSIKDFLQQQIHFNGNSFGNKCRCNEGSLYKIFSSF